MILRTSVPSPFGRMVILAAHTHGLIDDMTIKPADPNDPDDSLRQQNPLGKIPVLLVGDAALYDTRVILDYIDEIHCAKGHKSQLFPGEGMARHLSRTALARVVGMLDAGILIVYEGRFRPENMRVESFLDYQRDKIIRSIKQIKAEKPVYKSGAMPSAAELALACAIDHYDYRKNFDWRAYMPELEGWMEAFASAVPGYRETLPPDIEAAPWRS